MTYPGPGQQPPMPGQQQPYPDQGRQPRGGMFPFPHRSWQTRGGTQVSVGGCCLPLPIGCLATAATVAVGATRIARALR